MSAPHRRQDFVSFDGGIRASGWLQCPDRYRNLLCESDFAMSIPRGAGLSYAPASFVADGCSVDHRAFNRVLELDSVRRRVRVEAGISLGELHAFLVRHGFFLRTQPGHGRITIGGCVAADVHGKNQQRDGNFSEQVESIQLFHPRHGVLDLSRDRNAEIFHLTCGGFGLTGHIVTVELWLEQLPGSFVNIDVLPVADLAEGLIKLEQTAPRSDFVYTWHDVMARGENFGRGFLFRAMFVADQTEPHREDDLQVTHRTIPELTAADRGRLPISMLNRRTAQWMNFVHRHLTSRRSANQRIALHDALFPVENSQFYFSLFGKRGFHEYQLIIPFPQVHHFIEELRRFLEKRPIVISLASAKMFGGHPKLLRFSGDGICLALDFPRNEAAADMLDFLDGLMLDVRGRPNIIKDSRLPRKVMEAAFAEIGTFREQLHDFDPQRRFRSALSDRLGL